MPPTLKLVLTDHWFEEIKSGRKTHEYRKATLFWIKRILKTYKITHCHIYKSVLMLPYNEPVYVEFQKAYRKNPDRMTFKIKAIILLNSGFNTDLGISEPVFDIKLGERIR